MSAAAPLDAVALDSPVEPLAAVRTVPPEPGIEPLRADPSRLQAIVADALRAGGRPLDALREQSGLDPDALARALGELLHYPVLLDADFAGAVPEFDLVGPADAARRGVVLVRAGGQLYAVLGDPFEAAARGWLELTVSQDCRWAVSTPEAVASFVAAHEHGMRAIDSALPAAAGTGNEAALETLSLASISRDESPVVRLVHSTVFDALRAGASDVHVETVPSGLTVRYRLDGVLVTVANIAGPELAEQVISRIKVMSELDIAERRVPQDGRFKVGIDGRAVDFRVSVIPSVYGEDAVLRVLDKQALMDELRGLRLDGLGFEPDVVARIRRLSRSPYGMLLVTGPTGSGKTTTLYAAITETNTGHDKIVTIEDPVEYQLPGVLQIPVNERKGLTFARGLRSILRHDPDKIMVGEIRDPETAQIAIQSALTGHLVFTTVHANNVFDVVSRFVHMDVDVHGFVGALNGILAQRLLRVVCEGCAETFRPGVDELADASLDAAAVGGWHFRRGRGCSQCRGTGYRGRRAVGELLALDDELREAIVARAPVRRLRELALARGVKLMRPAALELVMRGQTTLEEVNRVTALA